MSSLSTIIRLLLLRCPSHVSAFIVSVRINTVNTVFRCWPESYFIKKFPERCKVKFNSSSAVVRIAFIVRILAAILSVYKRSVFGCALLTPGMSMHDLSSLVWPALQSGACEFGRKTTATFRVAVFQASTVHDYYLSVFAGAGATPHGLSASAYFIECGNGQPSECLAGKIDKAWTAFSDRMRFSHCRVLPSRIGSGESRRGISSSASGRLSLAECLTLRI